MPRSLRSWRRVPLPPLPRTRVVSRGVRFARDSAQAKVTNASPSSRRELSHGGVRE
jgi:hypothetical protein